jgi:predicted NBD/HSP70 family sugar kinase/predicted transcriptional regulator
VASGSVRQASRSEILWALLEHGVATRERLSTAAGLSTATVCRVIDDLVKDGLVRETASLHTGRRGRRITPVEFVGQVGSVVGAALGGTDCRIIAIDLLGKVIQQVRTPTPRRRSTRGFADWVADQILSLVDGASLYSVTVGLPGVVHPLTGSVRAVPTLPEVEGLRFLEALRNRLGSPVSFDNESNLALLGEMRLGAAQNHRNAVMFTIGSGLGAGVVLDGRILRGRTGLVGEFGCYVPVGTEGDTLENVVSAGGLLREAEQLGVPLDSPEPIFSRRPPPELVEVRRRFERALQLALLAVTTAYDPEVVVLGGSMAPLLENMLPDLQAHLRTLIPECPALFLSKLGDQAGSIGALILGLHEAYVQIGVDPAVLDLSVGPRLVELLHSSGSRAEKVA